MVESAYQKLFLEEWGAAAEKFTAALGKPVGPED